MEIKIANKDKIAVLELLGYEPWNDNEEFYILNSTTEKGTKTESINIFTFNFLDLSVLFKALDIIEENYETVLHNDPQLGNARYTFTIYAKVICSFYASTREEAILKTIIKYIKTIKN